MKKLFPTFLFLILFQFTSSAQDKAKARIDSLYAEVSKAKDDTNKVKLLNEIGLILVNSNQETDAIKILEQSQSLSKKINFLYGSGWSYIYQGRAYQHLNNYPTALEKTGAALDIFKGTSSTLESAECYFDLGMSYYYLDNNLKSIENFSPALKLFEALKNYSGIGKSHLSLGLTYYYQGLYINDTSYFRLAFQNMNEARINFEKIKDSINIAKNYNFLGMLNSTLGNYSEAIESANKGLKILNSIDRKDVIARSYLVLGDVYEKKGKAESERGMMKESDSLYLLSLKNYEIAFNIVTTLNNQNPIAEVCVSLGRINTKLRNFSAAKNYLERGLKISTQYGFKDVIKDCYSALNDLSVLQQDYKAAYSYNNSFNLYKDSLRNEDNSKKVVQLQMKYEFEKNEAIAKAQQEKKDAQQRILRNSIAGGLAGSLIFLVLLYRQRNKVTKEKKRSDELLLNILPSEVAEELKNKGATTAKHYSEVTVLFTDFKNFTSMSELLSPQELVDEINYCYSAFDNIITKHGIEKIKTIGDSYMCAGGLPVANNTNAVEIVRAAIEIRDFMLTEKQKRNAQGKPFFEIRIGCNTGPVVAGIVGIKKFAYDIWGDTVNIASRMESSGEPGKINISGSTYELVKDEFKCERRGKIEAKNKGMIEMYFVEA